MNINDLGGAKPGRIASKPHFQTASQLSQSGDSTKAENSRRGVQHTRDPKVVGLVDQLNRSPEIRTELVEKVLQKLESGEYLTRDAAESVADAVLRQA